MLKDLELTECLTTAAEGSNCRSHDSGQLTVTENAILDVDSDIIILALFRSTPTTLAAQDP